MKEQIEEMTFILSNCCDDVPNDVCENTPCNRCRAKRLYNEGYRKQSEVIDEFVDKLKEAPIKCGLPLLGLSTKEEIEGYFNGIMLQVRDAIDNIAKEMKGSAE